MDSNLLKTKSIEQLVGDAAHDAKALKRTLSGWDLTLLGIGAIIGTGIFVLTGTAAANQAGPAIVLAYVAAGLAAQPGNWKFTYTYAITPTQTVDPQTGWISVVDRRKREPGIQRVRRIRELPEAVQ